MGFHFIISRGRSYIGTKITAPFNGVVSFILNNRRKFGQASDRGCEAVLMDYGLRFPIYGDRIKPERKCCWFQINAGIISLYVGCPIAVGLYQCIDKLVSVWFYFIIIFIIEFVLMIFVMKFVSDGL